MGWKCMRENVAGRRRRKNKVYCVGRIGHGGEWGGKKEEKVNGEYQL